MTLLLFCLVRDWRMTFLAMFLVAGFLVNLRLIVTVQQDKHRRSKLVPSFSSSRTTSSSSWSSSSSSWSSSSTNATTTTTTKLYQPSSVESYWLDFGPTLGGFQVQSPPADGCRLWTNRRVSGIHYDTLQHYRRELKEYAKRVQAFVSPVTDLRHAMAVVDNDNDNNTKAICDSLELHPDGLAGLFGTSGALSQFPGGSGAGYVEPLLPPLRHPEFCMERKRKLLHLGYLIHDFAALCRHRLHRHSRTVFVDMGASLDFHQKNNKNNNKKQQQRRSSSSSGTLSPAIYITQTYQQFGFKFDHVYAYEVTPKNATLVYEQVPDELKAAYHWYNVGVQADPNSSANPLRLLLDNFHEHDFVVVKLDIDTPSIELPMVQMLLHDERLHKLVDCFYFEHHVFLKQLAPWWQSTMNGTVQDSLELFAALRQKGIAAHYWP